jgi:nitrate/TMAO reductase-like tetraheme cytochrome c subunit
MKKMKICGSAVLFLSAAVASAVLLSAAASAQPATTPDPLQIARGAKAWSENCGRCHNFRDPKEFSNKNWDLIVNHMRTIAPLPGAIARDIKVFLKASN